MNSENSITIVTSLPRSGTTTICEMAKICGFKPCHVLKEDFSISLEKYNFFADTPFYSPEYLLALSQIYKNLKFIYINRDLSDVYESMQKTNIDKYLEDYLNKVDNINKKEVLQDALCWNFIHKNKSLDHKNIIFSIARNYSIPILEYNFNEGWDSFCSFMECEKPKKEIPHLNKWQNYRYLKK